MQTDVTPALLDRLANWLGCGYLSDLKYLDEGKRAELAHLLYAMSSDAASLRQWNDALTYLTSQPGAKSRADARERLIRALEDRDPA